MQCHQIPSQRPPVQSRNLNDERRRWVSFLLFSGLLASFIYLVGCVSPTGLPKAGEMAAANAEEKAIVLLRVQCTIENEPQEPFRHYVPEIIFKLGSFETGGMPKQEQTLRFLTPESRRNGWTYFLLPRGIYYLTVNTRSYASTKGNAPIWRIDIPENAKLVYVGTLRLTGWGERLFFEDGRNLRVLLNDQTTVADDQELAVKLLAENFPGMGEVHIALMRRHENEPMIIRSPLPTPTK
jgi:hypothetical protein